MKLKLILMVLPLLLLLLPEKASCQKTKKAPIQPIKIINTIQSLDSKGFPLFNITFKNFTDSSIIINKVQLQLLDFQTNAVKSIPKTGELTPIAYWDLDIPLDKGAYTYAAKYPIQISPKDAATIQIRLYKGLEKRIVTPQQCGRFTFKLVFMTIDDFKIGTKTMIVGSAN